MNSKSEWNGSRIPRIVVEVGEDQVKDKDSGLGSKGEKEKQVRRGANNQERMRNPKRRGEEDDADTRGGGGEEIQTKESGKRLRFSTSEMKRKETQES